MNTSQPPKRHLQFADPAPPAKRAKLEHADSSNAIVSAFDVPASTQRRLDTQRKRAAPTGVSNFVPAFDTPGQSSSQSQRTHSSTKPLTMANFASTFTPKTVQLTKLKDLATLSKAPSTPTPMKPPSKPVKALEAPQMPGTPARPAQRLVPPPLPSSASSSKPPSSSDTKSTSKRLLQPPPMPLATPSRPHTEPRKKPLMPLSAPVIPVSLAPKRDADALNDKSDWKPVSATRLALATQLNSDDTDEVSTQFASAFLSNIRIGRSIIASASDTAEKHAMQRGIGFSPDKARRRRGPFAAQAESTLNRTAKATALWQEDIRARDGKHLDPALVVRVVSVRAQNDKSNPRSTLAECTIARGAEWTTPRLMLFSAHNEQPKGSGSSNIAEGTQVMVWKPWLELEMLKTALTTDEENPFFESTPSADDKPVLLCTRYVLKPPAT